MVFFKKIAPTDHYLEEHAAEVPWEKVVEIIFSTKNPRKKQDVFEIETKEYYVLFTIKNETLFVINAKKRK